MNLSGQLSSERIGIGIVSLANMCLLVTTAFYRRGGFTDSVHSTLRMKLGYTAVSFGLCSQVLYCLLLAIWRYGWIPFEPGVNSINHLEARLSNLGCLLSAATFLAALFARGLRRYTGLWVGGTTLFLWGLTGLGAGLKSFPNH